MEHTTNNLTETSTTQEILAHLKAAIQAQIGKEMRVLHLLELTPIVIEVSLEEPASGSMYFARCYRVPQHQHAQAHDLWAKHSASLQSAFRLLPQKAQGLKTIGTCLAYVAADVPGIDLETYLSYAGPIRPEFAIRTAVHLIKTLEKLAEHKCHHYQIHPGNIMITPEGKPVLKWTGLAHFEMALAEFLGVDALLDATYAAPEQLDGTGFLPATDIYQMGLLLYRMVAGAPPYQGSFEAVKNGHLQQPLPNPQALNKSVTNGYIRVLMRALAKDPKARFASLEEFKTALAYLQPALERAETTGLADAKTAPLKEKDKAQVEQLLKEAEDFLKAEDHKSALKTIDNVFVLVGYHGEAARLHQQAWEAIYGTTARKYTAEAVKQWEQGKPEKAFPAMAVALSVMPRYKAALKLQGDIFLSLHDRTPILPAAIDPKAYLGKAVELKATHSALAEGLWTQVLLIPTPADSKAQSELQFQKQLAVRGLRGLPTEAAAPKAPPAEQTLLATPLPDFSKPLEPEEPDDFEDIFADAQATPATPPTPASPQRVQTAELPIAPPPVPRPPASAPPVVNTPPMAPPAPIATSSPEPELDEEEDLLGLPPVTPSTGKAANTGSGKTSQPRKPLPKAVLWGGVALAAVVIVALGGFLWMRKLANDRTAAAEAAYQAAETLENKGDWTQAQAKWEALIATYPDYRDGSKRNDDLRLRIQTRKYEIKNLLDKAKTLLAAGNIYAPGDEGKSALDLLGEVLEREPGEPQATEMVTKIRSIELERVQGLYTSGQFSEAHSVYFGLLKVSDGFRDEVLEGKLNQWHTESVLGPGLANLEAEINKANWDRARELSDQLTASMPDTSAVQALWNKAFDAFSAKRNEAIIAADKNAELAALNALVEIRPEDTSLLSARDTISAALNHDKIVALEAQLQTAKTKGDRAKIISFSHQLRKLDSNNAAAGESLGTIRKELESQIAAVKSTNPRAALPLYQDLLKVSNQKTFRQAQSALQTRINQFDATVIRLKGEGKIAYETREASLKTFFADYTDFTQDPGYKALTDLSAELTQDERLYQDILKYEKEAASNQTVSYQEIHDQLLARNKLKFVYGRDKISALIATYKEKANNYEGTVTVVIRSAHKLPSKKKKGQFVVSLTAGDKTFISEPIKGPDPQFNEICTFQAKSGTALVFTLFEQIRKDKEQLGSLTLTSIPPTEKGKTLTGDGGWSLVVDIRRER